MIDRSDHPPLSSRDSICILALILLTLAVFWPVVGFEFVAWDDPLHITDNPLFHPPRIANVSVYWFQPFYGLYIPVAYTFWTLIGMIWMNPAAFHGANLLLHAGCVLLVYLIVRRYAGLSLSAALGAAVFAVHPLQVETVAWVSAFRDLLATMFALAAILFYTTGRTPRAGPLNVSYASAIVCFLLALLSKPTSAVLPLILLAMDTRPWRLRLMHVGPMFALAAACAVWTRLAQPSTHLEPPPLWIRPLVAGDALAFYLYKLIWPANLAFDYGRTPDGISWLTWIVPVAVAVMIRISAARLWVTAGWIFLCGLLPVLGLVPFDYQEKSTVADHYVYLSMLGVALAVAGLKRAKVIVAAMILLLGAWSWVQTWHWQNTRSLAEHGLDVNPRSWSAMNLLAWEAFERQDAAQAEALSKRSLEIRPDNIDALINLGRALAEQGRVAEAIKPLERAVEVRPDLADAHASLAAAYFELGRLQESMERCKRALKLNPHHFQAKNLLSLLLRPATTQSRQ